MDSARAVADDPSPNVDKRLYDMDAVGSEDLPTLGWVYAALKQTQAVDGIRRKRKAEDTAAERVLKHARATGTAISEIIAYTTVDSWQQNPKMLNLESAMVKLRGTTPIGRPALGDSYHKKLDEVAEQNARLQRHVIDLKLHKQSQDIKIRELEKELVERKKQQQSQSDDHAEQTQSDAEQMFYLRCEVSRMWRVQSVTVPLLQNIMEYIQMEVPDDFWTALNLVEADEE